MPTRPFPQMTDCNHNAGIYTNEQEKFPPIAEKHCIGVVCEVEDVIIWRKIRVYEQATRMVVFPSFLRRQEFYICLKGSKDTIELWNNYGLHL